MCALCLNCSRGLRTDRVVVRLRGERAGSPPRGGWADWGRLERVHAGAEEVGRGWCDMWREAAGWSDDVGVNWA